MRTRGRLATASFAVLLGAALIAVLWRTERPVSSGAAPEETSRSLGTPLPKANAQRTLPGTGEASPLPTDVKPDTASHGASAGTRPRPLGADGAEHEWEELPLDRNYGESLGPEGHAEFNRVLRDADPMECGSPARWRRPSGLQVYEGEYEVRLAPVSGGFEVVDAKLHQGTFSDASLEECVKTTFVGRKILFLEHTPGASARVLFPMRLIYKRGSPER